MAEWTGWRVYRRASAAREEFVVAPGDRFVGVFESPRGLRVWGRFEGRIDCGGSVCVERGGMVTAEVVADGDVVVGGRLAGPVRCGGCFEVLPGGLVTLQGGLADDPPATSAPPPPAAMRDSG